MTLFKIEFTAEMMFTNERRLPGDRLTLSVALAAEALASGRARLVNPADIAHLAGFMGNGRTTTTAPECPRPARWLTR